MKTILKDGTMYTANGLKKASVFIEDKIIKKIVLENNCVNRQSDECGENVELINCKGYMIIPGLIDVHVHFREPGFEYKETIATGAAAAAAGGYTTVCTMPNLDPAPWDMNGLKPQLEAIKKDACIRVLPYGRITRPAGSLSSSDKGESTYDFMQVIDGRMVADLEAMAPYVFAFSDDGTGVQQDKLMEQAMRRAKDLGKIIVAHCEDTNYSPEDPRSEYRQIERDLRLVEKTGCSYHVCHVSAKESVELIRQAKAQGLDVTCETAPHYLVFSKSDISRRIEELGENEGGRFRMNPPVRDEADRKALIEGIIDGTVDMIATDHAPHSKEEKSKGFKDSLNGILGLEAAFPVMYTCMVEKGIITIQRLIELMSIAPARRFGLDGVDKLSFPECGMIREGARADLAIIDIDHEYIIDPEKFLSKGRSTPFSGMAVKGKIKYTISEGKVVFGG